MTEFAPVTTLQDLDIQNDEDMVAGYRAGLAASPEPGSDKSRSYWHGWRNGRTDRGLAPVDAAQAELARRIVSHHRAH